jgi:hypothetical protein
MLFRIISSRVNLRSLFGPRAVRTGASRAVVSFAPSTGPDSAALRHRNAPLQPGVGFMREAYHASLTRPRLFLRTASQKGRGFARALAQFAELHNSERAGAVGVGLQREAFRPVCPHAGPVVLWHSERPAP